MNAGGQDVPQVGLSQAHNRQAQELLAFPTACMIAEMQLVASTNEDGVASPMSHSIEAACWV